MSSSNTAGSIFHFLLEHLDNHPRGLELFGRRHLRGRLLWVNGFQFWVGVGRKLRREVARNFKVLVCVVFRRSRKAPVSIIGRLACLNNSRIYRSIVVIGLLSLSVAL